MNKNFIISQLMCLDLIDKDKIIEYVNFCIDNNIGEHISGKTEYHHVLPKSEKLFPEFKNLKENPWNGVYLKYGDHYIAHSILAEAIENDSIIFAWWSLNRTSEHNNSISSILYEKLRKKHYKIVSENQIKRNKNKNIIEKRHETMSTVGLDGLTTYERQGRKISLKNKNKVYAYSLKDNEFIHIDSDQYYSKWYYVGRTAKYMVYYEYNGNFYKNREKLCENNNLNLNEINKSSKKPYKRLKQEIREIEKEFDYYDNKFII